MKDPHDKTPGSARLDAFRAPNTSRRAFIAATAGISAAMVVPRHVLGGPGFTPPSEKLHIAGIGIGGMGAGNLMGLRSEHIVALCDVDQKYAARSFRRFPDAKQHVDYRRMLDTQQDIDAVMVATPDHMHAPISMAAIRRGKHVYCEKPLTHTVYEARKIAEAAREQGVATQMGNRGQARDGVRVLCEWVWDGAIGPVREVHAWTDRPRRGVHGEYWPQGVERPKDTPDVPSWIDWNLWLGCAPERPYHPAYMPFRWRGWWDFGTGALGDIGCHSLDAVFRALKLGHPESVEACSSPVNGETYPLASMVTWRFAARADDMPAVKLVWYDGGLRPSRPAELPAGEELGGFTNGLFLVGDRGIILTKRSGGDPILFPESRRKEYEPPPPSLPRSPGHYKEWIDACKGGKPAGSNFDHAGPLTETVLLGNVALRRSLREKQATGALRWDGPNLKFTNVPEANAFLHREYRKGWSLEDGHS